ncbi:hypothetical protein H2204_004767 [Knufia peltigerae]|uniref:AB hydrolase-1 domain-containing protein n=1 Tax=Knufia peltigerae TaxID=1002370 RepID=A0AA38Y785_9EURO|nr:hypothetical protein H2204_004767 [Knufia peltigerae]
MGVTTSPSSEEDNLAYISLNPNAQPTVILIHGAFAAGSDWDLVTPFLTDYHLLIPDMPGHGNSRAVTPFSVDNASRLLRKLIVEHAHDAHAYIVGHSLGAHIAVHLASHYPQVVSRVLLSGFEVFPTTRLSPYVPHLTWAMRRIENSVPRPLVRWLMDGTDIRRSDNTFCTLDLCRQICQPMLASDGWPDPWPQPTLVIAAGKAGLLPTSDHPHDARKLAGIGNRGNNNTRAVMHPQMRHPWNRQAPKLFADTVQKWFRDEPLPAGFIDL